MSDAVRPGAAALLYTRDGRYLMQHRDRSPGARFPDWWCCFGGGIEDGEKPVAAMRRELREEIGFEARSVRFFTEVSVWLPFPRPYLERVLYFAVPIRAADLAGMTQREGADMALRRPEELAVDDKVVPWDLSAVLMHVRRRALFVADDGPR